ncbi:ATP-binding cassette domain-containing protein [Ligilactobacillus ceti]|uniref:Teichoic acid translocation ATP-binding protein n=1 Tax=Ligilactobacillus ceti DSM 22408 TaxID=1122146 RepID=A0A0R2KLR9_9LACO|nr:ATP-binding cassette domain-containing protein [Ligilactobacillus ceti]KRN90371.1 Teichoic acid translocation ATP-binding protein [Ligilactobacillus ceti DSM 22408]
MGKLKTKYITKSSENREQKKWWALRGINFEVNEGEAVGLVGFNGSGKATLLKILAGQSEQTTGFITCDDPINFASLSNLQDEKLTGLEHIKKIIHQTKMDEFKADHLTNAIVNFMDLGYWVYQPIETYSLEIKARLVLGIALFVEPKLVLIDEVLMLLDMPFYQTVIHKIQTLKDTGVSFVIADSRSLVVETLCERTLWLQFGQAQDFGPTLDVVQQYEYVNNWFNGLTLPEKNEFLAVKEKEQVDFDIDDLYEEFKVEQFNNGFTRKDEPHMRRQFYFERGADPIEQAKKIQKTNEQKTKQKPAKKGFKRFVYTVLTLVVLAAGGFAGYEAYLNYFTKPELTHEEIQKKNESQVQSSLKKADHKSATSKEESKKEKVSTSTKESQKKDSAKEESKVEPEATKEKETTASTDENVQKINVNSGDTLGGLADKYETTIQKIQELNQMGESEQLIAGQTLKVPK